VESALAGALATAVVAIAIIAAPASATNGGTGNVSHGGSGSANPYRGDGMWIWYISRSSGGSLARIATKAHNHGIQTLYIKSSDGSSAWSQFTRSMVSYLHSRGLRVCGWQFVYGQHPRKEARRGAQAVRKGADCLVIDAESTYEGHYGAASAYVQKLRRLIGPAFPVALATFPYVDYHPAFPYSVFLGRRGAQYNLPQLYWHTIGTSVGEGYRHTWRYNRVYDRQIYPLGQTYANPPLRQLRRFRRLAVSYGFGGVSWWDWQETTKPEWRVLGHRIKKGVPGARRPDNAFPALAKGNRGDLVVWAQEHLRGAGQTVRVTGIYGSRTVRAVKRFQSKLDLPVTGAIAAMTWRKLLGEAPVSVNWSKRRHHRRHHHGKRSSATPTAPRSASLPALHDEIPPPAKRH
jgi:Putative peptidoglycan binding domain